MKKRVEIYLSDEELKFLEWLAKYDNSENSIDYDASTKWTVNKEINALAGLEIAETMKFYKNEGLYNQ
jgi:hypothetical protein